MLILGDRLSLIPKEDRMKKVVVHKPGTVKLTGAATPKHAA
ncbi:hypothetical protein [Nonomuraea africana]|uniref:Uncharacterized protein n=1 Tax=Nonomuraea africana TaxID=46171 RepID=A0ABR9KLL3_9ACTN|nr:hypothetical protein [Nonomuraea africana]MBE1562911.1 hypothetical protein [Nonomuraea africana]